MILFTDVLICSLPFDKLIELTPLYSNLIWLGLEFG